MKITENWYPQYQIVELIKLIKHTKSLNGLFIEIGCWEGKSTINIANTLYPMILHAVDTWQGNLNEDINHITVEILKHRDVFNTFKENIKTDTKGNVEIFKLDCFQYLSKLNQPVAFCHIDASHNYKDVKKTIDMLKPFVLKNGILCGDDFLNAHKKRLDLNGGVERAVVETLPSYKNIQNFWYWENL